MQIKFYYNFIDQCDLLYKTKLYYLLQNLLPFHVVYKHTQKKKIKRMSEKSAMSQIKICKVLVKNCFGILIYLSPTHYI